jgi:hypothetical protein
MSKSHLFYNHANLLFIGTCHVERMDFINCMKLGIYDKKGRQKKETRCKEYFDKYIKCMKENENEFTD